MRSERERLRDILQAIEFIEHYTVGGKQTFEQDKLIQSGVLYQIQIIGEAARAMEADLREQNPDEALVSNGGNAKYLGSPIL